MNGLLMALLLQVAAGSPLDLPEMSGEESEDRIAVGSSGLLDVRLRDVSIFDALEMLAEQTQCNIVTYGGVGGTVSMVLRKVTFEEALHAILTANQLTHEVRDNIIYVMPQRPEPVEDIEVPIAHEMRVFRLSYISALDAETFIKPLIGLVRCPF